MLIILIKTLSKNCKIFFLCNFFLLMAEFSVAIFSSHFLLYYYVEPYGGERGSSNALHIWIKTQQQIQKKPLHLFDSTWCCKYSQHNQIQKQFANNHNTNKYKHAAKTEMRCKYAHTTSQGLRLSDEPGLGWDMLIQCLLWKMRFWFLWSWLYISLAFFFLGYY